VGAANKSIHASSIPSSSNSLRACEKQVERKIDELGTRLDQFPHHRLIESEDFRLRVGDYRIIYRFDLEKNIIYLITLGHRREIYR